MTDTESKVLEKIKKAKQDWKQKSTLSFKLKTNQLYLSTLCLEEYSQLSGAKGFYVYIPEKEAKVKVSFPFKGKTQKTHMLQKLILLKMLTDTYTDKIMVTRRDMQDAIPIDTYISSKKPNFLHLFQSFPVGNYR